ncbi:MAG: PKD domain-containing protein, partial [Bacteroidota bacterium]
MSINNLIRRTVLFLTLGSVMFLFSCNEDEDPAVPVASFTFSVDSETGGIVTFSNTSQNATEYVWEFGDGTTSTQEAPVKTYTEDGTYTVVLTA